MNLGNKSLFVRIIFIPEINVMLSVRFLVRISTPFISLRSFLRSYATSVERRETRVPNGRRRMT